jgi:hypothetical protein
MNRDEGRISSQSSNQSYAITVHSLMLIRQELIYEGQHPHDIFSTIFNCSFEGIKSL